MVFSIINTELDGSLNKLGIFGKSISEISNGLRMGRSVKSSLFSPITNDEIDSIKSFLHLLNSGVPESDAFKRSMSNVGEEAVKAADKIRAGTMSINDLYSSAGKTSKVFGTLKNALLNFGAALLVTFAIENLVKLFDYLITTSDELKAAMDTAFTSFQNAQKNTESIRSELETINGQIDTLNAKGSLTIVEEGQLKNLREAKRLAEMNLAIAERQEEQAAKEAAKSVFDVYNRKYGSYDKVTDDNVSKAYENMKGTNFMMDVDTDDISTVIAARQLLIEEIGEQEQDLAEYFGKSTDQIRKDVISSTFGVGASYEMLSKKQKKKIDQQVEDIESSLVDYEANVANKEGFDKVLEDHWQEYSAYYNNLLELSEDDRLKLYGVDKEAFDNIKDVYNYLSKFLEPELWSQQKLDELFDDEKILKAKDALVELARSQNGISKADLSQSGINLEQWQAALDEINAKYGTGFTFDNIVHQINSEANVVNVEEIKEQAEAQVQEEFESGTEVETEVKPKFTMDEYTKWLNDLALDVERLSAFQTIRLTPNFVISDHTPAELDALIDAQLNANKPEEIDFESFVTGSNMEELDKELSKIETLKEAMQSLQSGEFDNTALLDLVKEFPEAINHTGNMMEFLQGQIGKIIGKTDDLSTEAYDAEGIIAKFDQAIKDAGDNEETVAQLEALRKVILDIAYEAANMPVVNIEVETSSLEALRNALDEARSATGLTQESVEALQNRYKGLAGFNPLELFESTNTGLYLNNGVLADLEEAYELLWHLLLEHSFSKSSRLFIVKQENQPQKRSNHQITS